MRHQSLNASMLAWQWRLICCLGCIVLLSTLGLAWASETLHADSQIPVKDMVTMVAVGSEHCLPCKILAPILKRMKAEYAGRAAIICIDSVKEKELASRFKARVTPTLILYDREGNEVKRHEGMLDEKSIVALLHEAGMK